MARTRFASEIMQLTNVGLQRSSESRCRLQRNGRLSILHDINFHKPSKQLISRLFLYIALTCLTYKFNTGYCLQTQSTNSSLSTPIEATKSTNAPPTTAATEKPIFNNDTASNLTDTSTSAELLLLSGEDFVDSREVPSILFDGTTNNDEPAPATTTTAAATILRSNSDRREHKNSTEAPADETNSSQILPPSASNISSPASVDNSIGTRPGPTPAPIRVSTNTTAQPASANINEDEGDTNEEEDVEHDQDPSSNDAIHEKPFEPPQNISQYMDYIEKLFHDLRHQITDLFEPHLPQLIRTSQMVDLSSGCSYDMLRMALALRQFEPWALRMIDSSGKVPEGIFEGTFTALGSYDECLNTVFKLSSQSTQAGLHEPVTEVNTKQDRPTQGQYCLVTVSPFMPPKPSADKVDRLFQEEANRRNYTRDDQFSRLSPMFYYMKFRIGVCIPSSCHQQDMGSIAGALSSSLRLNISIPDCRVRRAEGEPLTSHQLAGGLIFGLVCASVLAATLLDCFKLKWKQIRSQERQFVDVGQLEKTQMATSAVASHPNGDQHQQQPTAFTIKMAPATLGDGGGHPPCQSETRSKTFSERLRKHWSWMSFSLLVNFRLYFRPSARHGEVAGSDKKSHNNRPGSRVINCLNGIRVLSLCWVIVANSYLTLDPRATKRLTKTREAPRDFLFQVVVQASLAIETFFFLSGLLMSLSFARQLRPVAGHGDNVEKITPNKTRSINHLRLLKWVRFYVHRYVRMTPPTMLVIAFSMYAYHYGDGPLWFEATQRVHQSCAQNWWRHLLHVANFIDTRQMCFIHYWYIAADMQLFLFAPLLLLCLYKSRALGYLLCALIGFTSIGSVFYTTYARNLPPTLLFYSTDPESRREFGNSIMTKPFAHALPYLVGMLVGWCFFTTSGDASSESEDSQQQVSERATDKQRVYVRLCSLTPWRAGGNPFSLTGLFGTLALVIALVELFLPYKWNNSHLPSRLCSALYAALFRFGWSLVLAFIVISCRHKRSRRCPSLAPTTGDCCQQNSATTTTTTAAAAAAGHSSDNPAQFWCFCGSGGNYLNRLLSLGVFSHLSKLSFVAYLVHLPLMSVFIGQTRGLFAFSHTLVLHFAISYLVMSFALSFVLAHVIEFPFVTFERLLFDKLHKYLSSQHPSPATQTRNEEKLYQASILRLELRDKRTNCPGVADIQQQIHRTTSSVISNGRNGIAHLTTHKL